MLTKPTVASVLDSMIHLGINHLEGVQEFLEKFFEEHSFSSFIKDFSMCAIEPFIPWNVIEEWWSGSTKNFCPFIALG